jgi:tryptophan synthase alpha subunit
MRTRQNLVEVPIKAGANIIELGVPLSDPIAIGPTIREAYYHSCPVTAILNTYNLCFHHTLNPTLVLP